MERNRDVRTIVNQQQAESKDSVGDGRHRHLPFWRVALSVIQASFGVQNDAARERDFSQGSFWPFVAAALVFTALFVLGLMLVVNLVLP